MRCVLWLLGGFLGKNRWFLVFCVGCLVLRMSCFMDVFGGVVVGCFVGWLGLICV